MERHYDEYPSDLQIFRDIMLPQSVTAMVLLNLAMFVHSEISRRTLPESERQSLETNLLKPAIRYAIQLLLLRRCGAWALARKALDKRSLSTSLRKSVKNFSPTTVPS